MSINSNVFNRFWYCSFILLWEAIIKIIEKENTEQNLPGPGGQDNNKRRGIWHWCGTVYQVEERVLQDDFDDKSMLESLWMVRAMKYLQIVNNIWQ